MALNAELLKKPQVLVIGGIALIGGIYISSHIKKKSDAKNVPPTEVTPTVNTVVSQDQLEVQDTQSRLLADTQQKLIDLEAKQQQERDSYTNGIDSERSRYQDQLAQLGASLGTQYSTQIETLKAQIEALKKSQSNQVPVPVPATPVVAQPATDRGSGSSVPVAPSNPGTGTPKLPSVPVATPVTSVASTGEATPDTWTPGYGMNYRYNCGTVPVHNNTSTWTQFVQNERDKGKSGLWNNTAQQRNLAQIAIGGTASKGVQTKGSAYGPVTATNTNRIYTNNVRAAWGLKPLTWGEWDQFQAFANSLWNGDENARVFQSGEYARQIFERYNLPYRCPSSTIR